MTGLNYGPETIRKTKQRKKKTSDSSQDLHVCREMQLLRVKRLTFPDLPGTSPPSVGFSLSYLVNYRELTPLEYGF